MSIATVRLVGAKSNGVLPLLSSCFYKMRFMKRRPPVSATETMAAVVI
ncbi:hypothetical protein B4119_3457 [Parageobacillus caldoxylosilyticus]|uniref:Uncharacterized protein n=1 Tax=Saccharococcus caldoxylosilyticus TaxID=81408 RepID=A0A150L6T2_9BACL|nr:hypothetical protein B4119_3457 [Parageobacillus caldoxylosilyticus]